MEIKLAAVALLLALAVAIVEAGRSLAAKESCQYGGAWVNDGDWLDGETLRCHCVGGLWRDCLPLTCRKTQYPPNRNCLYECPENSCVKQGRLCVDTIDDCECQRGYTWYEDKCVSEDFCRKYQWPEKWNCKFTCPPNSCVKSGRSCVDNFDDCECEPGYEMRHGTCLRNEPDLPDGCRWQGRWYDHQEWANDRCWCSDGAWKCAPESTDPPQTEGCLPNGLPFGLDNCVCDGATTGEAAGLAACGRVFNECGSISAFSIGRGDGLLESVQKICDTFALDACKSSSTSALISNPGCGELVRNGNLRCTPQRARQIFNENVDRMCDPLCKDCVRLP